MTIEAAPETTRQTMELTELARRRHPQNPKTHDVPQLIESLERFGMAAPVLLCERTGLIAAGHGRVKALLAMRQNGSGRPQFVEGDDDDPWMVPVARGWSSRDDDELLAYVIADNRQSELGGWDARVQVEILTHLQALPLGLSGIGYDAETLAAIVARMIPPVAPSAFPELDPHMETDYRCPRCAYEWSGSPAPGGGIPPTDESAAAGA